MNKSLNFINNLYNKLSENFLEASNIISENSDEIERIYELISKREMMMSAMTKLLRKEHHKISDNLYSKSDMAYLSIAKVKIFELAKEIDMQHEMLQTLLQSIKESLSTELRNVSMNKSKIKGYNLNCVK
jgi:hypothetical protein